MVLGVSVVFLLVAGFAVASVIGSFSTGDLDKGLVGHCPLDGAHLNSTTNRVDDISGYGNHGTNSGASLTTDRHGQASGAMSFIRAEGDNVNCGTLIDNNFTEYSVSLWVKANTIDSGAHDMLISDVGGHWWYISINGARWFYRSDNGSDSWGINNPVAGTWYHIVVTHNGSSKYLYIDGIDQGVVSASTIDDSSFSMEIGKYSGSYPLWNGSIADVRAYNRALSSGEVKKLYETYKPKFSVGSGNKGLVGQWDLKSKDEKVGSERWDSPASTFESGTYSWQIWGITTINNVGNALEITYGDASLGAYNYLSDARDLNTNLTIGKRYRLTFDAKSTGGSLTAYGDIEVNPDPHVMTSILTNTMETYALDFTANSTASNYFSFRGLSTGNIITVDNISLKPLKTADSTPYGNHGTIYGATVGDDYASFNGTSDYVDMGNDESLFPANTYSWSFWTIVNSAGAGTHRYFWGKRWNGANYVGDLLFIRDSTSRFEWYLGNGTIYKGCYSNSALPTDVWIHIAGIYDGTTMKMYINNALQTGQPTLAGPIIYPGTSNFRIGQPTSSINGQISNVKIYNRALSAGEVKLLYDKGR